MDVDAVADAETDMPMHSGTSKSSAASGFSLSLENIIKMFMRASNEVPYFGILENEMRLLRKSLSLQSSTKYCD